LQNSGIQFEKHEHEGINPSDFAEKLIASGLVLMEPVKWLSFHSGYDFGYLLNLLTAQNLPKSESEFFELLRTFFPNVYDVKYLMKSTKNLKGGLQEVANELEVRRIGPQHQAGSDSLLTGQTFFKMKEMFFEDDIDDSKYSGHLYGLGTSFVVSSSSSTTNANQTLGSVSGGIPINNNSNNNNGDGGSAASSLGSAHAMVGAGSEPGSERSTPTAATTGNGKESDAGEDNAQPPSSAAEGQTEAPASTESAEASTGGNA